MFDCKLFNLISAPLQLDMWHQPHTEPLCPGNVHANTRASLAGLALVVFWPAGGSRHQENRRWNVLLFPFHHFQLPNRLTDWLTAAASQRTRPFFTNPNNRLLAFPKKRQVAFLGLWISAARKRRQQPSAALPCIRASPEVFRIIMSGSTPSVWC